MSTPYGRQVIGTTGEIGFQILSGADAKWKPAGITIDWGTVYPVATDTVLNDGNTILTGNKHLRYGQFMLKITSSGKYGPYTAPMTATDAAGAITAGDLVINLDAGGSNLSPGDVLHIAAGGGTAEDVIVKSVSTNAVTLVAACAFSHTDEVAITKVDDGRQTPARGAIFVVNQTVMEKAQFGLTTQQTDSIGVLEGGRVWQERLLQCGTGVPRMAVGPTLAVVEAAFPLLNYEL